MSILWESLDPHVWQLALARYWSFVTPENLALERELNDLDVESLRLLDPAGWYDFLHDKYFKWKYTAPNRLATTRKSLRSYVTDGTLDVLYDIKNRLLTLESEDTETSLAIAVEIKGLGTAGASGLMSLMYPQWFATVDQFVVKALRRVPGLPETSTLASMNPESLSQKDGVVLITLLRKKANQVNKRFGTDEWTPRKLDMILWTYS